MKVVALAILIATLGLGAWGAKVALGSVGHSIAVAAARVDV